MELLTSAVTLALASAVPTTEIVPEGLAVNFMLCVSPPPTGPLPAAGPVSGDAILFSSHPIMRPTSSAEISASSMIKQSIERRPVITLRVFSPPFASLLIKKGVGVVKRRKIHRKHYRTI